MPRGRPKLVQKDNFHTHEGYARWHPIDQVHSNSTFHKSIGLIHDIVPQETLSEAKEEFEDYSDIYKALQDIEKGIVNSEILGELSASIDILLKPTATDSSGSEKPKLIKIFVNNKIRVSRQVNVYLSNLRTGKNVLFY